MCTVMTTPRCEIDFLTVVLIANFNPSIMQPRWMAGAGLLGEEEAKSAKVSIIAQDMAMFEVGEWLSMQVTTERFQAMGPFSPALKIRDLVVGLFSVLEPPPVAHLGINRGMHFRLTDLATRDALGERLVPPTVWPSRFGEPKMNSLRMRGARAGWDAEWITMTVGASVQIPETGVYLSSNEHYQCDGAEHAVRLLRSRLEASVRFARELDG